MQQSFAIIFAAGLLWNATEGARIKSSAQRVTAMGMRADDPPLSIEPTTTVRGCTCLPDSKCGPSVTEGFSCDWCRVDNSTCGNSNGLTGAWDYCEYPEMDLYEAQSADQKTTQLWNRITAEDVVDKSGPTKSKLGVLSSMISLSMRTPFDNHWDVMPDGRSKVIHSQGVHCQFDLDVNADSPYTGLFAEGKQKGIIRIGSASSNDQSGKPPFPGMSLKFLRSGVPSANFVALRGTGSEPQGYSFFNEAFTKIVNPPASLRALMKFQDASDCIAMVGLSDVCKNAQDGTPVDKPEFPFDIIFEASSDLIYLPDEPMTDEEMLNKLALIEAGTHLLNVYTKAAPMATRTLLGTLTTTTQCRKSIWGDEKLFFRHQRMEEDFTLKPEWIAGVDTEALAGCTPRAAPSSEWQCPGIK